MKVAIIGGSIAGLSCATFLSQQKHIQICLFEKHPKVVPPICAEGISVWASKFYEVNIPEQFYLHPLYKAVILSPKKVISIVGKKPYGYIIDRFSYQKYLLTRLKKCPNVTIRMGYEVREGGEVEGFDYVVGADGIAGFSRKLANLPPLPKQDLCLTVQRLVRGHWGWKPYSVHIYFGSIAPGGYAWLFPHKKYWKCGLGVTLDRKVNAGEKLNDFICKKLYLTPVGPIEAKLLPVALATPSTLVKDNILLIGDAGCVTDPATGGGIIPAIYSARAAAYAIAQDSPELYPKAMRKLLIQAKIRYRIKNFLSELTDYDFDNLLESIEGIRPSIGMNFTFLLAILSVAIRRPRYLIRFMKTI